MSRSFNIRLADGAVEGPYKISLDVAGTIATKVSGGLADNVALTELTGGSSIDIVVLDTTSRIIIENVTCGGIRKHEFTPKTTV